MTTSTASGRNIASKEYAQPYMPAATYTPWQRPSDWLTLPSLTSTLVFTGLVAVFDDSNNTIAFFGGVGTGTYTIDWGDGTSNTSSGATGISHTYNYNDLSSSTLTTRGYRQAIITVTMTSGSFTGVSINEYVGTLIAGTSRGWLDIKMGSSSLATLNFSSTTNSSNLLENISIESCSSSALSGTLFSNLSGLKQVSLPSTAKINNISGLFSGCASLIAAPMFDTSSNTAFNNMFFGCAALQYLPVYVTTGAINMSSMFEGCKTIKSIPQFNTSNVTSMNLMFSGASALKQIPYFNTGNVTTMSNMFGGCYSLTTAPTLNTVKVTSMSTMFFNCNNLTTVPLYDTGNVTSMDFMFSGCDSLTEIPLFNTTKVLNTASMFTNCQSLKSFPNLNLANVTNCSQMFNNCSSIADLSMLSLPNATVAYSSMFTSCTNLINVPTSLGSNSASGTFSSCFTGCTSLQNDITLYTGAATSITSAFQNCTNISNVTIVGSSFTSLATVFSGAKSVRNVVFSNCSAVTTGATTVFTPPTSLTKLRVPNLKVSLSVASTSINKDDMEIVFNDLLGNATSQTITITSTPAVSLGVSSTLAPTGQAAGTVILTVSSSSGFVIGQPLYNTTIFAAAAVTMQDTGDTVTRTSHGIPNGTRVSFATIVSTTGISVNTIYYVVNATTNTFQVSLTNGGAPLALTTNGSGTLRFEVFLIDIPSSTQLTLSCPTTAATNNTNITSRPLNTYLASLKNWTVSG